MASASRLKPRYKGGPANDHRKDCQQVTTAATFRPMLHIDSRSRSGWFIQVVFKKVAAMFQLYNASRQLTKLAEELAYLVGEELGFLEGGEVAAAGHLLPASGRL